MSSMTSTPRILPCPKCWEMIYSDTTQCRFCSAPVDVQAAEADANLQEKVNDDSNQAKWIRNTAGAMWVFLVLGNLLSPKPDPLSLEVEVKADGQIRFNKQDMGTISETGRLSTKLAAVFQERSANEKTVRVRGSRGVRFQYVAMLMDVVKGAGAKPIVLVMDDLW